MESREEISEDDEDFGKWFQHIAVVPGGRFIFSVSPMYPDKQIYVKLWDIGRPGTQDTQIKLLAQYIHYELDIWEVKTAPIEDGRGIRLAMACTWYIFVFEIYPENLNPAFELKRSISLIYGSESDVEFIGIHGDRIVSSVSVKLLTFKPSPPVRYLGYIFVWDFIEDQVGVIHTGSEFHKACAIRGNSVISLQEDRVYVWGIPELQPVTGFDLSLTEPITIPLFIHSHSDERRPPFDVRQDIITLSPDQGWYSDPKVLQLRTWEVDAATTGTALFTINDDSTTSPLIHAKIVWGNHPRMQISDTLQLCHQNIITLQATSPGYVHLAGIPIPDQPSAKVIVPNIISFSMDGFKPDV
ncbi:hypothetical protein JR316_0008737 [Psilocybe cubensis]|nr:hypothetical protein JR316_0008737 [Psilocybe cubensis]KAH9478284.1 hypothetical protein JR316_0008737 [Psilocybe cubensis]